MTLTPKVKQQLSEFTHSLAHAPLQLSSPPSQRSSPSKSSVSPTSPSHSRSPPHALAGRTKQMWTAEEHERFLEALQLYPSGPWRRIAEHVGTKNARQSMSHCQKFRQKITRWQQQQAAQVSKQTSTHCSSTGGSTDTNVIVNHYKPIKTERQRLSECSNQLKSLQVPSEPPFDVDMSEEDFFEKEILPILESLEDFRDQYDEKNGN